MSHVDGANYITQCRQLHFSDNEITVAMQQAGWDTADIHVAFMQADTMHTIPPRNARKSANWILWLIIGITVAILLFSIGAAVYVMMYSN